jgi:hypothetical protein
MNTEARLTRSRARTLATRTRLQVLHDLILIHLYCHGSVVAFAVLSDQPPLHVCSPGEAARH